jgi:hypothetical protein
MADSGEDEAPTDPHQIGHEPDICGIEVVDLVLAHREDEVGH